MKKNKKGTKRMILNVIIGIVVILIAISFFPVKLAVYADENDERTQSKLGILSWNEKVWDDHMECIIETSELEDRPKLRRAGWHYIGDSDEGKNRVYYNAQGFEFEGYIVQGTSPLIKLNFNFDPCKVKNYFAVTYESFYEEGLGEIKEGYYELPIIIYNWAPVYPIQRSGTLANLLLPKRYLTVWDFIGKSAIR